MIKELKQRLAVSKKEVLEVEYGLITYVNPFAYLKAREKIDFSKFALITSDGIVIKLLSKVFFGKNVERISPDFSSYFTDLFENACSDQKSIYFVGTEPGLIEESIKKIQQKYPKINIVGFRNGYFNSEKEKEDLIVKINQISPQIVIVGMGTPHQELFLIKLRESGWSGLGISCGGFLHQTAFKTEYYPSWINKMQLRWLYRIYREPKLFKRYTIDYAWFLLVFLSDLVKSKF